MAHHTLKSGYENLVDRLNRFPQGAPPSKTLFEILRVLFDEKEAGMVSLDNARRWFSESFLLLLRKGS